MIYTMCLNFGHPVQMACLVTMKILRQRLVFATTGCAGGGRVALPGIAFGVFIGRTEAEAASRGESRRSASRRSPAVETSRHLPYFRRMFSRAICAEGFPLTGLTVITVIRCRSGTLESAPRVPDHIPDTAPPQIIPSFSQYPHPAEVYGRLESHQHNPQQKPQPRCTAEEPEYVKKEGRAEDDEELLPRFRGGCLLVRDDAEEGDGKVIATDAVVKCDQGDELGKGICERL